VTPSAVTQPDLLDMPPSLGPGRRHLRHVGDAPLRLHANEHAGEVSANVIGALATLGESVNRYPAPGDALRSALADRHHVEPECVLIGAGSAELITLAWHALTDGTRSVFFHVPAFELYPLLARRCATPTVTLPVAPDGCCERALDLLTFDDQVSLVALSNPHNPTGALVPRRAIERLARRIPPTTIVLNDEAYIEYTDLDPADATVAELCDLPNVLTTRTFSKLYGLAGLRVGYAIGAPALLERLAALQTPFTVTALATTAALTALDDPAQPAGRRAANASDRSRLSSALEERGFGVRPSAANFLLCTPPGAPSGAWVFRLLEHGIRVHSADDALRITVGPADEQDQLLHAIETILSET
jgi:histidinol-phosphate aminotransferase